MATVHHTARDEYRTTLRLAKDATNTGVIPGTTKNPQPGGTSGLPSAVPWALIPSKIPAHPTPATTFKPLHSTEYARGRSLLANSPADLATWKPPYTPWVRRSPPCWGLVITTILGCNPMARSSMPSNSSSRPMPKPTPLPHGSTPSPPSWPH